MWGLSSEKWHFVLDKIHVDTVQCEAGTVRIDFATVPKWCLFVIQYEAGPIKSKIKVKTMGNLLIIV